MKSGGSHSFHAPNGQQHCPVSKGHYPTSDCTNVMETDIFCGPYLKINNSTVNEYFLMKFCNFFQKYIQNSVHIILLGSVEI